MMEGTSGKLRVYCCMSIVVAGTGHAVVLRTGTVALSIVWTWDPMSAMMPAQSSLIIVSNRLRAQVFSCVLKKHSKVGTYQECSFSAGQNLCT